MENLLLLRGKITSSFQRRIQNFQDREGDNPYLHWGKNLLFDKIFAENCMKMKEIDPPMFFSKTWSRWLSIGVVGAQVSESMIGKSVHKGRSLQLLVNSQYCASSCAQRGTFVK